MANPTTALDRSPEALRELRNEFPDRMLAGDVQDKFDEIAAYQKCEREWKDEQKQDRNERITTETLELVSSVGAGAMSTWKSGGMPLGGAANMLIGGAAKVGSFMGFDNRIARVTCNAAKTLLHSQIAIITREAILGKP